MVISRLFKGHSFSPTCLGHNKKSPGPTGLNSLSFFGYHHAILTFLILVVSRTCVTNELSLSLNFFICLLHVIF